MLVRSPGDTAVNLGRMSNPVPAGLAVVETRWTLLNALSHSLHSSFGFGSGPDRLDPPGHASLSEWLKLIGSCYRIVTRSFALDDNIERCRMFAMLLNICLQLLDVRRGHLREGPIFKYLRRKNPVPLEGTAQRLWARPGSHNPDGNPRLLRGRRDKGHLLHLIMLANVAEGVSTPEAGQNGQRFIEPLGTDFAVHLLSHL